MSNPRIQRDLTTLEQAQHTKNIQAGLKVKNSESIIKFGRQVERVTYTSTTPTTSKKERAARIVGAAALSLTGVGAFANLNKDFRENTWEKGINGEVTRTAEYTYFRPSVAPSRETTDHENPQLTRRLSHDSVVRTLGFDPKVSKATAEEMQAWGWEEDLSVSAWASKPENKAKMMMFKESGHGVISIPPSSRGGISSFIFCPNGDTSKAFSWKCWDAETGNSILDGEKYTLAMRDFCDAYSQAQQGLNKKAQEITDKMNASIADPSQHIRKDKVLETLRGLPMEIDSVGHKIYVHYDVTAGSKSGIALDDISEDVWKNIDRAHNRKLTESKQSLNGEKPFEHVNDPDHSVNNPSNADDVEDPDPASLR